VELGIRVKDFVIVGTALPFSVTVTSGASTVGIIQNFTLTVSDQNEFTFLFFN